MEWRGAGGPSGRATLTAAAVCAERQLTQRVHYVPTVTSCPHRRNDPSSFVPIEYRQDVCRMRDSTFKAHELGSWEQARAESRTWIVKAEDSSKGKDEERRGGVYALDEGAIEGSSLG